MKVQRQQIKHTVIQNLKPGDIFYAFPLDVERWLVTDKEDGARKLCVNLESGEAKSFGAWLWVVKVNGIFIEDGILATEG